MGEIKSTIRVGNKISTVVIRDSVVVRITERDVGETLPRVLPAWHTVHAMNMLDEFRELGCRMLHGVTDEDNPEVVLGPLLLPNGIHIPCSMSLHDDGWSYYVDLTDFGQKSLEGSGMWALPQEIKEAIHDIVERSKT